VLARPLIIWRMIWMLAFACISLPLYAQAITINPDHLQSPVQELTVGEQAFFVNGPFTHGLSDEEAKHLYPLGPMSRTLVSLVTLRMHAAGLFSLDEPIVKTLPNILDENPFQVAITPRHLMTETAGFAALAIKGSDASLSRATTQVRTAGQMAHSDHVGWSVLIAFIEAKAQKPFLVLAKTFLLLPIGQNLTLEKQRHGNVAGYLGYKGNGAFIAELARLMIRNRDKNGARFLPDDLYAQLVERHNWRMHPIGPRRTLGGVMRTLGEHTYIAPPPAPNSPPSPTFAAFPDQGIAFVTLKGTSRAYFDAVKNIAEESFLPAKADHRLEEAKGLRDAENRFSGIYVRSDAPSAWLKDRLNAIKSDTLQIKETATGAITVTATGRFGTYEKQAPYYYRAANGEELLLSPYRQGGYLVIDDTLYRYVGILGNKTFVLSLFPLVMLMLFSSVIYIRSKTSPRWRKMALFGTFGALIVGVGLWADYTFWPQAVFVWDVPWLVNIWRLMINVGLAFVLSLPLFAAAFTKKNEMPTGAAIFVVPLHLAMLSISAIFLFLILVAWGMAGEISAY